MEEFWKIPPGRRVRLKDYDPADTSTFGGSKRKALARSDELRERLESLQELFYACHREGLLIVLQALDTGGKDGTTKHVFEGV
ncbi:MAG: polyphosphate kinase 2 family protein, partial [Thermoplasmata archaeon]